jgi:hypothetical protein
MTPGTRVRITDGALRWLIGREGVLEARIHDGDADTPELWRVWLPATREGMACQAMMFSDEMCVIDDALREDAR